VPLTIGLAGVGGCYAVLANAPTLLVAIAATGVVGLAGSLLLVTVATTIQRGTPAPLLGRVSATFYASDAAATVAGALAGAAAGHPAVLPVVLTWSAGAILLCAVVAPVVVRGNYSVRGTTDANAPGQRLAVESAEKTSQLPGI
jgi:hypothetical protein